VIKICVLCLEKMNEEDFSAHKCNQLKKIDDRLDRCEDSIADIRLTCNIIKEDYVKLLDAVECAWKIKFDTFERSIRGIFENYDNRIGMIDHRIDSFIRDLHDWKDHIVKRVNSSISFDIIHQEIQVRETWQAGCEHKIETLYKMIKNHEEHYYNQENKEYVLHAKNNQIEIQKQSIQQMLDKIKMYENRVEVLTDCLDRKSQRFDDLKEQYEHLQKEHERDTESYIARIKEMQAEIARKNEEIHDLRNRPLNINTGNNCT
jgi:chromosome segregation ATPase